MRIKDRTERARRAIEAYRGSEPDDECHLRDLVADLLHAAHVRGDNIDEVVEVAASHTKAEILEEDGCATWRN